MKRIFHVAIIVTLAASAPLYVVSGLSRTVAAQQSGNDLFQQALSKERAEGQLDEAIRIYERIVKEFANDRPLAAKALLQMGRCYERLGKAEAQKTYDRLVREYADQRTAADEARARLVALSRTSEPGQLVVRRVWSGPGVDLGGSISLDGRQLAFVDWDTGDLALRDMLGGATRRLTNKGSWSQSGEYATNAVIAPDGRRLAYTWQGKHAELRVITLNGGTARVLYRNDEVAYLSPHAWAPDGKSILATVARRDLTNQIVLISVSDGSLRALKTVDWRTPEHLSFSPDGRQIAYDFPPREDSRNRDIFVLDTDGGRETAIVTGTANDYVLGWAPSRSALLFASDRTGTIDAWMIRLDQGRAAGPEQLVKRVIGNVSPLGFTKTGAFHYGLVTGMMDVYTATLDPASGQITSAPFRATSGLVGSNIAPAWSPDGRYLTYITGRTRAPGGPPVGPGQASLVIRSIDTSEERTVTPRLSHFYQPHWSPDGSSILVRGTDFKGRWGLYLVAAPSGQTTPVAYVDQPFDPAWSPDGATVFYRSRIEDDPARIIAHDLKTEVDRDLYRGTAKQLTPSPDGRYLAFIEAVSGAVVLRVMPLGGGPARDVIRSSSAGGPTSITWTPDSRYILFSEQGEAWRVPFDGGDRQSLGLRMPGLTDLRLHPDGRRLAFGAGKAAAEVWVMENFLPALDTRTGDRRGGSR